MRTKAVPNSPSTSLSYPMPVKITHKSRTEAIAVKMKQTVRNEPVFYSNIAALSFAPEMTKREILLNGIFSFDGIWIFATSSFEVGMLLRMQKPTVALTIWGMNNHMQPRLLGSTMKIQKPKMNMVISASVLHQSEEERSNKTSSILIARSMQTRHYLTSTGEGKIALARMAPVSFFIMPLLLVMLSLALGFYCLIIYPSSSSAESSPYPPSISAFSRINYALIISLLIKLIIILSCNNINQIIEEGKMMDEEVA